MVDSFSLWETHTIHTEYSIPPPQNMRYRTSWELTGISLMYSCQEQNLRILPVSSLIGLCYPDGFLIVSHRWEYQPTPPSLRTLRPRVGKGCGPGSDSNWVDLNPGLQDPTLLLFPKGLSGLLHSRLLWTRLRGPRLTQRHGISLLMWWKSGLEAQL